MNSSHVVSELQSRFVGNPAHEIALGLLHLLPSECTQFKDEDSLPKELAQAVEIYKDDDCPRSVMLSTEYGMWIREWKQHNRSELPNRVVDALQACSVIQFPNLHVLLQIALTLPITLCESERSFSQLKLIKTSRHSTMTDSRLSGLALMKINRDRCNKLTSAERMEELVRSFTQLHP